MRSKQVLSWQNLFAVLVGTDSGASVALKECKMGYFKGHFASFERHGRLQIGPNQDLKQVLSWETAGARLPNLPTIWNPKPKTMVHAAYLITELLTSDMYRWTCIANQYIPRKFHGYINGSAALMVRQCDISHISKIHWEKRGICNPPMQNVSIANGTCQSHKQLP